MGRKRKNKDNDSQPKLRPGRKPNGPRMPWQVAEIEKKCRLANWLFEQKRFDQCRTWLQMALNAAVTPIPNVTKQELLEAQVLTNFIEVDRAEKKWADAVTRLRRAIDIYEKLNLPDPMPMLHLIAKLIEAHGMQQQLDDAEAAGLRLVGFVEQQFGREDQRYATALGSLATVYFQKGKGKMSLKLLTDQLQLLERLHGPDHPKVADCLLNVAHLFRWMRRPEEAEPYERRAKEIEGKQPTPGAAE